MATGDLDVETPSPDGLVAEGDGFAPPPDEWRRDKQNREYTPRQGKAGIIYRRDGESIPEARARDAAGREQRPRRDKKAKPKMPEASRKLDSKELEESLAAALKAPGAIAMTFSPDEWLPEHFNTAGPYLARHIVLASEHNPWLRRRLEEAAQGQDAMWAVISLIGVGGALFAYIAPPVVYLFNLPVPETARARWGMPARPAPPYAAASSPHFPEPTEPQPQAA